jgi:hypothetical protein
LNFEVTTPEIDILPTQVAEFTRAQARIEHDLDNVLKVTGVRGILSDSNERGAIFRRKMAWVRATRQHALGAMGAS